MSDVDKSFTLRGDEVFDRYVDATPYLLDGQYVESVSVEHTPPDGDPETFTQTLSPSTNATGAWVRSTSPFSSAGWHLVDVVLSLTGSIPKVFRYRVYWAG
ncbi:MAG TPA: hypothetical protein PLC98_15780 [Anaerolineales bacterium]|nr:hypothetical protein [Anaerolineales bacterium]